MTPPPRSASRRSVAIAEHYAQKFGIPYKRQSEYVDVNEKTNTRIADAYEAMQNAPQDPEVREAYADLAATTLMGVPAEYAYIGKHFWEKNKDWKMG